MPQEEVEAVRALQRVINSGEDVTSTLEQMAQAHDEDEHYVSRVLRKRDVQRGANLLMMAALKGREQCLYDLVKGVKRWPGSREVRPAKVSGTLAPKAN